MMPEPRWLTHARSYLGLTEIQGPQNNQKILEWWKELGTPFKQDSVPWCGAFVGGVLAECDMKVVTGPASARSWLRLPVKLDKPAVGAVVIFWRGSKSGASGHVGFIVGKDKYGNLMVLGGNQADQVNIKAFSKSRVLGYRWPGVAPLPERFNLPVLKSDGTLSQNEA